MQVFSRIAGTRWLNKAEIYKQVSRRKSWNVDVCNNFDFVVKVEQEFNEASNQRGEKTFLFPPTFYNTGKILQRWHQEGCST